MEFSGRLTADASIYRLTDGREVTNFTLAMNDRYTTKAGEKKEVRTFIKCAYWVSPKIVEYLKKGYEDRRQEASPPKAGPRYPVKYVSWTNHLDAEANALRIEEEAASRRGDPPSEKLNRDWSSRMEDVLWAMLNAPEWVFVP